MEDCQRLYDWRGRRRERELLGSEVEEWETGFSKKGGKGMSTFEIVVLSVLAVLLLWVIVGAIRFEIWYHDHRKTKF